MSLDTETTVDITENSELEANETETAYRSVSQLETQVCFHTCAQGERIVNKDLENDVLDPWMGYFGAISTVNPHSGLKCFASDALFLVLGQYFSPEYGIPPFGKPIPVNEIFEASFWLRSADSAYATVAFITETGYFGFEILDATPEWKKYDLKAMMLSLGMTAETLIGLGFGVYDTVDSAVDDFSLIACAL